MCLEGVLLLFVLLDGILWNILRNILYNSLFWDHMFGDIFLKNILGWGEAIKWPILI